MMAMTRLYRIACYGLALIAAPLFGQEPLATLDGEPILESDLSFDRDWRKLEQQTYQKREEALNSAIATRLLNKEAERRGITSAELIEAEVSPKVGQPTNQEVTDFYNQQKSRINKPLKEVRDEIVAVLRRAKAQRHLSDFIKELWSGSEVKVMLEPPRLPVNMEGVRTRGPEDATVTVVEYSDFQCPYCRQIQPVLAELAAEYEGKVRWAFKDMPLADIHPEATRAAIAGRCADEQGKFWDLRTKLFEQELFTDGMYSAVATELGMKTEPFVKCMESGKYDGAVQADFNEARGFGLDGTPAFLVNGVLLSGAQPIDMFRKVIDRELGLEVIP